MQRFLPVVDNVFVLVAHERFLLSSLENVDPVLVHRQPQVLGQRSRVALEDVKDGGAVERPLADEQQVVLVALLLGEVSVVAVLAGNVLGAGPRPHVLRYVPLYDGATNKEHE